jgi:hypothetical protein
MDAVDPHVLAAASASRFLSTCGGNSVAHFRDKIMSGESTHLEERESSPRMQVHLPSIIPERIDPRREQSTVEALEISSEFLYVSIHFGNMRLVG